MSYALAQLGSEVCRRGRVETARCWQVFAVAATDRAMIDSTLATKTLDRWALPWRSCYAPLPVTTRNATIEGGGAGPVIHRWLSEL